MRGLIFIIDLLLASFFVLAFLSFYPTIEAREHYFWIYDELTVLDKEGKFSNLSAEILNETKLVGIEMKCYEYDGEWKLVEVKSVGNWSLVKYVGRRITLKGDRYCVVAGG